MKSHYLYIDKEPSGRLLTFKGQPVWPVQNENQMAALTQVTKLFSCSIKYVQGCCGPVSRQTAELVVAVGKETGEAAELYAHLTGRTFKLLPTVNDVLELSRLPSVLVILLNELNATLLNRLASARDVTTGIICAESSEALHTQVLIRSAAAKLCGDVVLPRIDVCPLLPIDFNVGSRRMLLGGKAGAAAIRSALSHGAGVLTLDTHSDGIDAFLGADLTLCPILTIRKDAPLSQAPFCQPSGTCYRRNLPVTDALQSSVLFSPMEISGRIVIVNSCRTLLLPGALINPLWGYAIQLLQSPLIGAAIMTWEMTLPRLTDDEQMLEALVAGVPVGKSLLRFLRSRSSQKLGVRFCLFGDPRVRVRPRIRRAVAKASQSSRQKGFVFSRNGSRSSAKNDAITDGDLRLWKAALKDAARDEHGSDRAFAATALDGVRQYQRARVKGRQLEGSPTAAGPIMRQALLHHLLTLGFRAEWWIKLAVIDHCVNDRGRCPNCGEGRKSYFATFKDSNLNARHLDTCANCEVLQDGPLEIDWSLTSVAGKALRVKGELPREHWTAGLLISSWNKDRMWQWPDANDGGPEMIYEPPSGLPSRLFSVALFILWETRVVTLRLKGIGAGSVTRYENTPSPLTQLLKPVSKAIG